MPSNLIDNAALGQLQNKLAYNFKRQELLAEALTHSSYANENKKDGPASNERLEFLGDSVLGMTVAEMIYILNPDMTEGRMTRLRAELVCEKSLADLSVGLGLGEYMQFGRGEEKSGGRVRPSILADAFEAVIAAMYLDGGFQPVKQLLTKLLSSRAVLTSLKSTDYKTALQEIVQEKSGQVLRYIIVDESGPDHLKCFKVEVLLNGVPLGAGTGKSKKEAEQDAAKHGLEELKK